jgi:predicted anti-sigma-YlaC factor YlaD
MMNDCLNVEIREALPELVHGGLPEHQRALVQQHLDECGDCSAELSIIRAVYGSAAVVPVDVGRIITAIPPYRRKASRIRRAYLELAAACVIGAVGISAFALHNSGSSANARQNIASAGAGLALVNTSDLTDAGLAQLTRDLDQLQAMPTADPESVTPVALESAAEPGTLGDSQ